MDARSPVAIFAATDIGRRHKHNEDQYLVDKELGLCMVCDGMGGHAAGEIASAVAVRTVHEELLQHRGLFEQQRQARPSEVDARGVLGVLQRAVQTASSRIFDLAQQDDDKRGMGTTLSLLLLLDPFAYIAHVGDSRIYLERDGAIHQMTEDHTVANELIQLGMAAPEKVAQIKLANALTRAVGVYAHVQVDTLALEVLPTDQFLLASDGLTRYFKQADQALSYLRDDDGVRAVRSLIDFANQSGGIDNITAVLMRLGPRDAADAERARRLALKREVLAKLPLFARLDERELMRVMHVMHVVDCPPGTAVVQEGERGDELYVVLTGRLQVSRDRAVLREIGPGEHLGEMALIRSRPRSATVLAVEPSELVCLRRQDFLGIIRDEPHIAVKLLWQFVGVLADWLDLTSKDLSEARKALAEDVSHLVEDDDHDPFGRTNPIPIADIDDEDTVVDDPLEKDDEAES